MREVSADKPIVSSVISDPEPNDLIVGLYTERTISESDTHGGISPYSLEPQRRMARVDLQRLEAPVGNLSDCGRQFSIVRPESRRRAVLHKRFVLPLRWSAR